MFKSIRWTLQLWHAGLLAVVLIGFGGFSYLGISRSLLEQLNGEVERAVQVMATGFRPAKPPDPAPGRSTASRPALTTTAAAGSDSRDASHGLSPPEFEVPASLVQRFVSADPESDYYVVWDREGHLLAASNTRVAAEVPYPTWVHPDWSPTAPGPPLIRTRAEFHESFVNGPHGTRVLIGASSRPMRTELRRLAFLLTAIGAGVLAFGLVGGWLVSHSAVRPIRAITAVAQEISASNLSRRIASTEVQSELGSLAAVLNDMFARLDAAFQHQVRFTADASHELRTPLSVIHTHVQLALSRERSAEEYRNTIEVCQRASSRMKDLVDSLLLLAGADAGRLALNRERADLRAVVENCVAMVAPLAEARGIVIEADLRPAEPAADPSRISQVITNLLTNAIRYNRTEGRVTVCLDMNDAQAVLTISDTGIGIPAESQPHIFERFYRVDKARSREEGGSGLGLAICKTIVEAHGGTITFYSEPGRGTTFEVRLPLAASMARA